LSLVIAILTLALVAAVVLVVSAPLRSGTRGGRGRSAASPDADADAVARRGDLEAAREAKYREIRDAELDYRTGKLSREDYEAIDRELRAEAIEVLDQLEAGER
jgi:hypothetical protein